MSVKSLAIALLVLCAIGVTSNIVITYLSIERDGAVKCACTSSSHKHYWGKWSNYVNNGLCQSMRHSCDSCGYTETVRF